MFLFLNMKPLNNSWRDFCVLYLVCIMMTSEKNILYHLEGYSTGTFLAQCALQPLYILAGCLPDCSMND